MYGRLGCKVAGHLDVQLCLAPPQPRGQRTQKVPHNALWPAIGCVFRMRVFYLAGAEPYVLALGGGRLRSSRDHV
jgi:hypothetical protein